MYNVLNYICYKPAVLLDLLQDLNIRFKAVQKTMKWVQDTLRMLQEQISRVFTHRILRYIFQTGVKKNLFQHRQHSSTKIET